MSSETPSTSAASQAAVLRRAWLDVAVTVAPQLEGLPELLDARLDELESHGAMDEAALLAVAEQASQYALEQGAGEVARALSKRLRRAIYEFLLALDAVHPAELADQPVSLPPPISGSGPEPRTPVAFTPADVPGADEPVAVRAPVRLWEEAAPPPPVREVYRVATRDVEPLAPAGAGFAIGEAEAAVLDEMDAAPEAAVVEFADAESVMRTAEALIAGAESHWADVAEAAAEWEWAGDNVSATDAVAAAEAGAPVAETVVEPVEAEVAEAFAPDGPDADGFEAEPVAGEAVAETAGNGVSPEQWQAPEPTADEPHLHAVDAAATWTDEPQADPAASSALDTEPVALTGPANGVKPPRDLLRVPRQFRRLPPLAARHDNGHTETPSVEPVALPELVPAEPVEAQHPSDDDSYGVPSVPWGLAEPAAQPEPEPAAPAAEVEDFEEEMGVPFGPFTFATAPADAAASPTDATDAATEQDAAYEWTPSFAAAPADAAPDHAVAADFDAPSPTDAADVAAPFAPAAADRELAAPFAAAADVAAAHDLTPAFAAQAPDLDLPKPPALAEQPLHPFPAADDAARLFITPLPAPDPQPLWTPGPVARPSYATPIDPSATPFPIAPVEGFHLTDPGVLEFPAPAADNPFLTPHDAAGPPAAPAPENTAPAAPVAPQPASTDHPADPHDDGHWGVRQSPRAQLLAERMAQKRREEAARAAFQAASVVDDDHDRGRKKRRGVDDSVPDLPTARRQLDEHLRKKRGAEAGALLQRLAQQLGGREIADLALDSGDRCRALGQSRSATNCYLAAWRADPLYETPLWRLSDICLNDQEIELAVGYLERIAELMRSRSDDEGAIGVYRKIAMIAPERQDVRDVIRLAKTTGRLDG
ncbi:MAG TPA: hypothetical protein VN193_15740 [Candidatus Angelobacter sp.]|nr:hypothetical protein [Candidatus Angelobacter sp.]